LPMLPKKPINPAAGAVHGRFAQTTVVPAPMALRSPELFLSIARGYGTFPLP